MRFIILVSMLALVLFLLRDSGYWALVVLPYGALLWVDGTVIGRIHVMRKILALRGKARATRA